MLMCILFVSFGNYEVIVFNFNIVLMGWFVKKKKKEETLTSN